jgi:hypothetical protein
MSTKRFVRGLAAFAACALFAVKVGTVKAEQVLPHYDPDEYCEDIAGVGGAYSEGTKQSCIEIEQEAYDKLKELWDDLPDRMQNYCDQIAKAGGKGSYSTLQSCIDLEQQAAEKNRTKRFKY